MATKPRILILGAGFAGQTSVLHLVHHLKGKADIRVVNPFSRFTWIPSLIWVGVGNMDPEATQFELGPVYARMGVDFTLGKAVEIRPETREVVVEAASGARETYPYDYLVNATGPYLNFEGTPGLGPATGNSLSVCTVSHAVQARDAFRKAVADLRQGKRAKLLVGIGHPMATCEGAAFEYIMNVDAELRRQGVRDLAELTFLSNEPEAGDFGVDGIMARKGQGYARGSVYLSALFDEHRIKTIFGAGVTEVRSGALAYDTLRGDGGELEFDFAMLIPQFRGIPMAYTGRDGRDLKDQLTLPSGLMKVDADYSPKSYDAYKGGDWPGRYQNPDFPEIFAPGIAFAPPHPLSKPGKSPSGMAITATAPRTGMAAGIMGRTVALNITDLVEGRPPSHSEPMSRMPGACIASTNKSLLRGSAVSIVMHPVAKDFEAYPETGRDLKVTTMENGLAGAWIKRILHSTFLWKFKGRLGWRLIPE